MFEPKARQVIAGFAYDPPSAPQFAALRVAPILQTREVRGERRRPLLQRDCSWACAAPIGAPRIFTNDSRLVELQKKVNEPYRGDMPPGAKPTGRNNTPGGRRALASRYADRGVEQTVELLEMFPDLAAGIVLTVVTAGVAGPLVGVAAGAGVGLVQGGVHVANATSDLTTARDGNRIGAVSEERVAFLGGGGAGRMGHADGGRRDRGRPRALRRGG